METESMPLIRGLFESIEGKGYTSFRDVNSLLYIISEPLPRPVGSTSPYTYHGEEGSTWNFNYGTNTKTGTIISGIVLPNGDNGFFLGLERCDRYPHIFADFLFLMQEGKFNRHLIPIFLRDPREATNHIMTRLTEIRTGNLKELIYLDQGEYLETEAGFVLEHAEQLPLEEEITLLELFDSIAIQLAEINAERVAQNKKVVEFSGPYQEGIELIRKVPPKNRTPVLDARLQIL